jgi:AcrR family transcriptional regulator
MECTPCVFAHSANLFYSGNVSVDLAPTRRERKKQATRQALHEAAFTLAEEYGLANVTVEAIADRADVAPRTFFNYFSCKEDAILDRDPDRPEVLRRAVIERPAGEDALTALRRVMEDEAARRVLDADRFVRRVRLIRAEPQLRAAMAGISDEMEYALVAAVAERTGRDSDADLYPALVVSAAWGAFKVAHLRWGDLGGRVSFATLLASAFDTLSRGLGSPPPGGHHDAEGARQ